MADRTYMQLTVLECPRQNVNDVVALLADYNFCEEGEALTLGEQVVREEVPLGTLWQELAPELAALCSFTGWEDPAYEYSGTRVTSLLSDTEGSRIKISECFQDGHPVVSVAAVRQHLQLGTVEELLQTDRETAIEALAKTCKTAPTVLEPYHYVIIERERSAHLAIRYPDRTAAEWALSSSFFINSLYKEDCFDAFVSLRVDEELREGTPRSQRDRASRRRHVQRQLGSACLTPGLGSSRYRRVICAHASTRTEYSKPHEKRDQ